MRRPCQGCQRWMRTQGQLLSDFPGTIAPGRNGFCQSCNKTEWPLGPHMTDGDELDLGWLTDPALKALIHERRTRGIPAAGLPATGAPTTPKPRTNPLGHQLTQWIERNTR